MIVYVIAAPQSLNDRDDVIYEIERCETKISALTSAGHIAICPLVLLKRWLNRPNAEDTSHVTFDMLSRYSALMHTADIAWSMADSHKSEIAQFEIEMAEKIGLSVERYKGDGLDSGIRELGLWRQDEFRWSTLRMMFGQIYRLLKQKNSDYGSSNIAMTGEPGVAVRLSDKVCRLLNMFGFEFDVINARQKPISDPNFESIEDTWRDIVGYAAIGMLLSEDAWRE